MIEKERYRFQLRDLFALVAVAALLMPVVIGFLNRAVESSRQTQCRANLANIGFALHSHANLNPISAFCSGASDLRWDGCIDTIGWVADVQGVVQPTTLIDPANPLKRSRALQDLVTLQPSDTRVQRESWRYYAGKCGSESWSNIIPDNRSGFMAGTLAGSQKRQDFVTRYFDDGGFNTNYVPSWYLVRGAMRTQSVNGDLFTDFRFTDFRDPKSVTGPLWQRTIERSRIPSSMVPFMGCGAAADVSGVMGNQLTETMTAGPSYWDAASQTIRQIQGGVTLDKQIGFERNHATTAQVPAPTGNLPGGNDAYLQDTRNWTAVHDGQVNLLMADGSVKVFHDQNGDALLNPGFATSTSPAQAKANTKARPIYVDSTLELPPNELFGGVILNDMYFKGNFDR